MSKYVLLLGGRMAVFGFDLLQCFYGCNIGGVFCFRTGGVCEIFGEAVVANRRYCLNNGTALNIFLWNRCITVRHLCVIVIRLHIFFAKI